jgi:hypothetical protein
MTNVENLETLKKAWGLVFDIPPAPDSNLYRWICLFPMNEIELAFQNVASFLRHRNRPMTEAQIRNKIQDTLYYLKSLRVGQRPDDRKNRLLSRIAIHGYSMEHLDFSGEKLPEEYYTIRRQRLLFKEMSEGLIDLLIQEKKTDEQIVEEIMSISRGNFRCTLLPDLKYGETRRVVTNDEFRQFIRSAEYDRLLDEHDIVTRLTLDGRWAIDVVAKEENSEKADDEVTRA